jgi:hypothetical protein
MSGIVRTESDCGCGGRRKNGNGHSYNGDCGCGSGRQVRIATGGCECGDPERCGVPCLERPLYHAGQLLTADVLRSGQHYIEERLALRRFLDGVGVVCGLHVRCDPEKAGWVIVEPGYAIDCCGRDVALCEPVRFDLCAALSSCDRPADPCAQLQRYIDNEEPSAPPPPKPEPEPEYEVYALSIRGAWEGQAPVPVITSRGACDARPECRPSRERASVSLCVEPLDVRGASDRADEFQRLDRKLMQRLDYGLRAHADADATGQARGVVDALLLFARNHPARSFCAFYDMLCDVRRVLAGEPTRCAATAPSIEQAPARLAHMTLDILDDLRSAYLERACDDCCEDTAVGLAHVYVDPRQERCSPDGCGVVALDTHPPGRETLHPRSGWWDSESVSLYDAYFLSEDAAAVLLTGRGLRIAARFDFEDMETPATVPAPVRDWFAAAGQQILLHRIGVYQQSDLYAPASADVILWLVNGRVFAIQVGGFEQEKPRMLRQTKQRDYRYAIGDWGSGSSSWTGGVARRYDPDYDTGIIAQVLEAAPGPFTLIKGIGDKTAKALLSARIESLQQLRGIPPERVQQMCGDRVHFNVKDIVDWQQQIDSMERGAVPLDPDEVRRSREQVTRLQHELGKEVAT